MVKVVNRYEVDGSYEFHGTTGFHSGVLEHYDDGRLIGKVSENDCGSGNVPKGPRARLVLGLHNQEEDYVHLLKLSSNQDVAPILWNLRGTGIPSNEPRGEYEGYWVPVDWRYLPRKAMEIEGLLELGILGDETKELDLEYLREEVFPEETMLDVIRFRVNTREGHGNLIFTEKH